MNFIAYKPLLFVTYILLSLYSLNSFAWNNSIDLGYGISHDPNHTKYNNSGILLSSDLSTFKRTPLTHWTLNGAVGRWYTTAPCHKHLTTVALALALRFYSFYTLNNYPPYLLGSVGPAFLSSQKFGKNTQGSNFTFQVNAGLGIELNQWDLNFRFVHYSNAYIVKPDQGFTILYMLSIGYLY